MFRSLVIGTQPVSEPVLLPCELHKSFSAFSLTLGVEQDGCDFFNTQWLAFIQNVSKSIKNFYKVKEGIKKFKKRNQ